jgi:hypothetical protein
MSKKKSKPAARKAPKKAPVKVVKKSAKKAVKKKAVKKKAVKKSASRARVSAASLAAPERTPRTKTANIFIFQTGTGVKIRTSPQRLYANPGDHVEFNVVNMIDDSDAPVTIEFPEGGPWGKDPFEIRSWGRKPLTDATAGRYKFTVRGLGVEEDPELEIPDGN